jgi:hypothetical protein
VRPEGLDNVGNTTLLWFEEEPDYLMALDLLFFTKHFGADPHWLRYQSRPVISASFLAHLIPAAFWHADGPSSPPERLEWGRNVARWTNRGVGSGN